MGERIQPQAALRIPARLFGQGRVEGKAVRNVQAQACLLPETAFFWS